MVKSRTQLETCRVQFVFCSMSYVETPAMTDTISRRPTCLHSRVHSVMESILSQSACGDCVFVVFYDEREGERERERERERCSSSWVSEER